MSIFKRKVEAQRPTLTTTEVATMVVLVASMNPNEITGRDAEMIKSVIHKAKSISWRTSDGSMQCYFDVVRG